MAPTRELDEISLPLGSKISDIAIIIINLTEETSWNNSSDWTTNSSLLSKMSLYDYFTMISLGTILGSIVILTIFGNLLVLLAVSFSSSLRSTTNCFIVNLAIADLLLGILVLPFSAFLEMNNKQWIFGHDFCNVWAAIDVLCCTASIVSLCVISVDRYIGVTRPLAYSNIVTHRRAVAACVAVWGLSVFISVGPLLGWKEPPPENPYTCEVTKQMGYVLFSVSFSFYIPCFIIFIVYFRIYKAAIEQTKFLQTGVKVVKTGHETTKELTLRVHAGAHHVLSHAPRVGNDKTNVKLTMANLQGRLSKFRRQKKAAKTLGIVVGVFILCWFPFFFILPLGTLCRQCYIPQLLFDIFFWTGYVNSCLNPIIYACSSRDFKRAFRQVLHCTVLGSDRDLQSFRARTINFTLRSTRRSDKKDSEKMTFDVTKIPPLIQPQYSLDSESPGSINENNLDDDLPPAYHSISAPTIAEAIKRVNSVIRAGSGTDTDCTVMGSSE
ncbi:alpha-1A adrenergic receptor-like [Parasteatoda tepidariorum]|uniref:alpha-1A adrenergic receptor-like n=1 Tax=Parasteatoda tepidariorum TaxID=114398 RepID=UPI00077FA73D|nr:alpha-1A adrenergic receptor-like [Parasteatoda tepidariorum]XP_021004379.1 alpha-1A adrenergic receptor-like [Parasteatoda tepidariorum]